MRRTQSKELDIKHVQYVFQGRIWKTVNDDFETSVRYVFECNIGKIIANPIRMFSSMCFRRVAMVPTLLLIDTKQKN